MATTSTNILTTLGASNIDSKQLTSDLVNAVKAPRQKLIDSDKKRIDAQISSAGLLKSALDTLKSAATELGTLSKLNKLSISNSNSTVMTAEAGGNGAAIPGNYALHVNKLAMAERRQASISFATSATAVSASDTTLSLKIDSGETKTIEVKTTTTAAQLVSAINSSGAGATARLVNTGSGYVITMEGPTGASNTITTSFSTDPGWSFDRTQTAQNAEFTVNGIAITRSSNTVTDVVDGMTFRLSKAQAAGDADVQLGVTFDSTQLNAAIDTFVQSYNLFSDFVVRATGVPKEGDDIAGTLKGNSTVKSLLSAVRGKLTSQSTSKSGSVGYWSDLGLTLDRYGVLQFDQTKFQKAFDASPTDAIRAMSNNAPAPYLYSGSPSGLAGDMAILSNRLLATGGTLSLLNSSFTNEQKTITTKQTKLDEEMQKMTDRYTQQFSAMNAVLAQMKTTSNNLTATFSQNKSN